MVTITDPDFVWLHSLAPALGFDSGPSAQWSPIIQLRIGIGARGFVLAHDRRSDQEMKLWQEWRAREGWKIEPFPEYLERLRKDGDSHERK